MPLMDFSLISLLFVFKINTLTAFPLSEPLLLFAQSSARLICIKLTKIHDPQ